MKKSQRKDWALLVAKGYFPEELPSIFNSHAMDAIISQADFKLKDFNVSGDRGVPASAKLLTFSIPHVRGYRRILGIPGPFHYAQLAQTIIEHRDEISELTSKSPYSIYREHEDSNTSRFIAKPDFKQFTEQRILKSTGYRYLLTIDVARFYSSIYTHSLPWAIHGKIFSKNNTGFQHFGNLLDLHARNCQDKQTMGIPIGPDSSRVLSEIILSAVDEKLASSLDDFDGIRNVDDYFLYFKTYADAETGRTLIEKLLREYELELNISKEKIITLPEIIETSWKTQIRNFRFRVAADLERADLISFFDLAFTLARRHPDEIIMTYAIAKLRGMDVRKSNWKILQSFLLNSMVLESRTVVQVSHMLLNFKLNRGLKIDEERVIGAYESFMSFHAKHDHHFEIVWALWFFFQCNYSLSAGLTKELNQTENDFIALMLLDMENGGWLETKLDKSKWESFITSENLFSDHWLLAYEGVMGKYFHRPANFMKSYKFFDYLKKKQVRFFNVIEVEEEDYRLDEPKSSLAKEMEANDRNDEEDDNEIEHYDDLPF